MKYIRTLSIAGSDSGGGAGIQADLKTFSALGCFGMTAITAATAQNTRGVKGVFPLPASFVAEQIEAVCSDTCVDAVKIGMLHNQEIIEQVSRCLSKLSVPIVLDPVMAAKNGQPLFDRSASHAMIALFPKVLLVTPNLDEASILLGRTIERSEEMAEAGLAFLKLGAQNALIKGGHLEERRGCDCLVLASGETLWIEAPQIDTQNTHGTGCTYSAAIAAYLAHGIPLVGAVHKAKEFLHGALQAGARYDHGSGHGPLHHFYRIWPCA